MIDGRVDDDCWENVGTWSGTFVQQQPDEGKPETEETHIKILYDDHNMYVAFRAYDSEPEKINRWLAPRDQLKGDAVAIIFDSYDDKRTGFCFALTAGGTRADFLVSNTSSDDYTWNAVWDGKVSFDDKGWYAEFRIPLSQLRYSNKEVEQEWGMGALRSIDRKLETDHLHLIPRQNDGFVHSLGRLTGISNLPKSRRIELSPYTSLKYQLTQKEEGNPYATGSEWGYGAGLDGKIGLSSDFTLDFTINPDFGQVEADPSTINLTAFETYYEEKRPFFLEGKNIFSMLGEKMFYSRRIGSRPQWSPDEEDGRYSKVPEQTHILSAVKVSGKSKKGLSLGIVNSLTSKESARITENGREYRMTAQPFTSYSVARVQQDIKGGNTVVGGMISSVNRSLEEEHLSGLTRNAYVGAVDFEQYILDRRYYTMGSVKYSYVEGSKDAITKLQRSPVHYFQREGATHVKVDESRTSLQGTSGSIMIGRGGKNNKWIAEQYFNWASPGFELNDMGYLESADYKLFRGYIAYVENTPTGIFRNYNLVAFHRTLWDYSGVITYNNEGFETNISFMNKWYLYFCAFYEGYNVSNGLLRGGMPVRSNPRWGTDMSFGTDQAKKVWFKGYHGTCFGSVQRYAQYAWAEVNYRPIPNLGLTARLEYDYMNMGLDYVASPDLLSSPKADLPQTDRKAYILAARKQNIVGLTLRMDYSITPDLSVQFYGNPFMSSGKYTAFKRATNTMDKKFSNRFRPLDDKVLAYHSADNNYSVTEANGDTYTFDNPDFSFREFRFNLVARWEYRPNSILYLVWGQERSGSDSEYISSFSQNTSALFKYHPNNVLMLKLNYWFSL
ncbi:hypothetical protein FACS189411_10470 [Bacteroidia bacterium]|nr:hypothetical protein FACS189411_10470 [Bacteroidia bacterium]